MTVSSALNAGVQGLAVNATRLGTIADNIANSDTIGYKRVVTDFQALVLRTNSNNFAAGGVRVETFRQVEEDGSLISTGNSTDIAISGRGLLPVTDVSGTSDQVTATELNLIATGSFSPDANGFLRTASGHFLLGWPTDSDGNIGAVTRQGANSLEPVQISANTFESTPTANIGLGINLPADATATSADLPVPFEATLEYFDNFGRTQTITAEFTPDVSQPGFSNAWSVDLLDNSTGTPVSIATFDVDFQDTSVNGGAINSVTNNTSYDANTGEITLNIPGGGGQSIQLFVGQPNVRTNGGLGQIAANFDPSNIISDGVAITDLRDVEINEQGQLEAVYENGFRQILFQIPVADVPNLNGLTALNNQAFSVSQESGDVYFHDAGSGPVGTIQGFALTESTTDIASELTSLIETQRAYSSNARVISAVDEILQETTNIIR